MTLYNCPEVRMQLPERLWTLHNVHAYTYISISVYAGTVFMYYNKVTPSSGYHRFSGGIIILILILIDEQRSNINNNNNNKFNFYSSKAGLDAQAFS